MIELGSIPVAQRGAIQEARKKIRLVLQELTGDLLLANRVASLTSAVSRTAQRLSDRPRIVVRIDPNATPPNFVMDFGWSDGELDHGLFAPLFDSCRRVRHDGEWILRASLELPPSKSERLTDRAIVRLRSVIEQKGRDALMEELQAKNRELQDSFDDLRRTTTAKERMESELNVATDIQMSMLPLVFPPFPHRNEFTVFATLHPAREVGGDFYDFFFLDEDRFCFCVGDVSGKGVPAALFMAVTKTLIKSRATNDFSPASILTHVNEELSRDNDSAMFVTLWVTILDVTTGRMTYTNAGHNPPYLKKSDGTLVRLDRLHGPVVGAVEGLAYSEDSVDLEADDVVFLYTDGVTEAMDPEGTLYEEDRLVDVLSSQDFDSVEEIVEASTEDVWRFQAEAEQADDVTVLAVKFFGRATGSKDFFSLDVAVVNQLEEIDRVNRSFEGFSAEHGLSPEVRRSMKLVFDDLLNNVISYAYQDEEEHVIEVHVELSSDRLAVRITDDGHPFNPFAHAKPDTALEIDDREIGGLGIHIVESLMDEVSYTRRTDKNVIVLVKYLLKDTQPEKEPS